MSASCAVEVPAPARRHERSLFPDDTRLVHDSLCGLSINPYGHCDIRCGYCINGAQGPSRPVVAAAQVAGQLRAELMEVPIGTMVGVGSVIDAYPNAEAELGITRIVLTTLVDLDRMFVVVTKNSLVRRDLDVLASADARVVVSLATLDARWAARLEPGAPSPEDRVALIRELSATGVEVWVSVAPWTPDVSDVPRLLSRIDPALPVSIAPLNVSWHSTGGSVASGGRSQAEIDAAYLDEVERVGTPANVAWLPPPTASSERPVFEPIAHGEHWLSSHNRWLREAQRRRELGGI